MFYLTHLLGAAIVSGDVMAKIVFNSGIREVRGAIDDWVYKRYKDKRGLVLSRRPDMRRVKPSAAQKKQRQLMSAAAAFYRTVKGTPALLARYQRLAKKMDVTVPAACVSDYLKKKKQGVDL